MRTVTTSVVLGSPSMYLWANADISRKRFLGASSTSTRTSGAGRGTFKASRRTSRASVPRGSRSTGRARWTTLRLKHVT